MTKRQQRLNEICIRAANLRETLYELYKSAREEGATDFQNIENAWDEIQKFIKSNMTKL